MNWQLIFLLSKVNGGLYLGDELPPRYWGWPMKTWLQERLHDVREKQWPMEREMNMTNLEAVSVGSHS